MSSPPDNNSPPPVPPLNGDRGRRMNITDALANCGVTQLYKEGLKVQMMQGKNNVIVAFKIYKSIWDTMEEFDKKAAKNQLPLLTIQRIKTEFATNKYYSDALQYREEDDADLREGIGFPPETGNFFMDDAAVAEEVAQEQAYRSEISDPDYTDEGLPLFTVSAALRLDSARRFRVTGTIDTTRPIFDLIKQIILTCTNKKCNENGKRSKPLDLRTGMFSLYDLPYIYPGGQEELARLTACPKCHEACRVDSGRGRYQAAMVIELKHVDIGTDSLAATKEMNDTTQIERLTVLISGKHTLNVRFGEEVEIVGGLQILPSSIIAARRSANNSASSNNIFANAEGGKYQKIVYANRVKYTKRETQVKLTEEDIKAIKRFASKPNLIPRLVSMFAPNVADCENAKLGLLIQAVGPAPLQKESWFRRRTWINSGLFGDPGTGKSILGEEAVKLIPGSQMASAQHSTGKGIVAVAEREPDGSAFVRAGAAVLANNATIFVDEIGSMRNWEDQDQFNDLMERGYCDFNKLGIRQKIRTKARFILGSNPITLTWKNTDSVDKNELPIKLTLVDRLDIIHIFRDVMGDEATREWSAKMLELALKHINTDYLFLRKYIHYICTEPKFREFKFESKELAQRLSDLWTEIKITYPTLVSKRGYQSIFRIASAVARLLCKETIDSEVIEQTVNYIKAMYHEFGAQVIDKSVDRPQVIFVEICEVITNYAKGLEYIMSDDESSTNISFKEAAQTACDKNPDIRDYFGVRKRDNGRLRNISHNIRLRSMHDKFDELGSRGDGIAYSNGKIKVIENKPNVGLILRWVADSNSNSNSNSNPASTRPRTDDAKQL